MPFTLSDLINAGLPADDVFPDELGVTHAKFSRPLTPGENILFLEIAEPVKAARLKAILDIDNIPNWATWKQSDLTSWHTANLSDAEIDTIATLADAKVILKIMSAAILRMGQMSIALRDILKEIITKT